MPRQRSRSRSIHRCYSYESYSEASDDDRGRPITRLINLIRPRSRSAGININQNIYQGPTIYDEDNINGPVYQAGRRGRMVPQKAGNNYGSNHVHLHYPRHNDESDDEDYYDDSRNCRCNQCGAAEMAERLRQKREKAQKAIAQAAAKKIQKENDALEQRLRAIEMSRSRHMLRDREDIEIDLANVNRTIGEVYGQQQHVRRTRSQSRHNVRYNPQTANIFM